MIDSLENQAFEEFVRFSPFGKRLDDEASTKIRTKHLKQNIPRERIRCRQNPSGIFLISLDLTPNVAQNTLGNPHVQLSLFEMVASGCKAWPIDRCTSTDVGRSELKNPTLCKTNRREDNTRPEKLTLSALE